MATDDALFCHACEAASFDPVTDAPACPACGSDFVEILPARVARRREARARRGPALGPFGPGPGFPFPAGLGGLAGAGAPAALVAALEAALGVVQGGGVMGGGGGG